MALTVHFDVPHLYYLPQYLPLARQLSKLGHQSVFVMYEEQDLQTIKQKIVVDEELQAVWVKNADEAFDCYLSQARDWIVFGHIPSFKSKNIQEIQAKTALMLHGIGPKSCYYTSSDFTFDVRFVEGETRLQRLQNMYPSESFIDAGFAKLDPLFNQDLRSRHDSISLTDLGLNEAKKTILYAPTFYPSSIECLPKNWPEQLSEYNLIVKPHFFSLIKHKYAAQRKLLSAWASYDNVHVASVEDYTLLPFMQIADILLSEASSSMFEFITLDKPVVWCDFYHKRWSYRGLLSFRLSKRLDEDMSLFDEISTKASSPNELLSAIKTELDDSARLSISRKKVSQLMAGNTDGLCSERIVEYLVKNR